MAEIFLDSVHAKGGSVDSAKGGSVDSGTEGTTRAGVEMCADLLTNVYSVTLRHSVVVHRYKVVVTAVRDPVAPNADDDDDDETRDRILSEPSHDDFRQTENIQHCMSAFMHLKKNAHFRGTDGGEVSVFYNGSDTLYSVGKPLNLHLIEENKMCKVIQFNCVRPANGFLGIEFGQITDDGEFTLDENDSSTLSQPFALKFLDTVTSNHVFCHPKKHMPFDEHLSYFILPQLHGFEIADCPKLPDGNVLEFGAYKAIRPIERGVAVVVDSVITAFHSHYDRVIDIVQQISESVMLGQFDDKMIAKLNKQLKGLRVGVFYRVSSEGEPIVEYVCHLDSVLAVHPRDVRFLFGHRLLTVDTFFSTRKNCEITYPEAPLLKLRKGKEVRFVPMEFAIVMGSQRVQTSQETPEQVNAMTECYAVPPSAQMRSCIRSFKQLKIDNDEFRRAGFRIQKIPLSVPARVLDPRNLFDAKDNVINSFEPPKTWAFTFPANFPRWNVVLLGTSEDQITKYEVRLFMDRFIRHSKKFGLEVPEASSCEECAGTSPSLMKCFDSARSNNLRFMLFLLNDDLLLHDMVKYFERAFWIPTMVVKLSALKKVAPADQISVLTNIVAKANAKLGGRNYSFVPSSISLKSSITDGSSLFIGLSLWKRPRTLTDDPNEPSFVLGCAANVVFNDLYFVGDCFFPSVSRFPSDDKEILAALRDAMSSFVNRTQSCATRHGPTKLIVYVDRFTEEIFQNQSSEYIHEVRKAVYDRSGFNGSLTFISVSHTAEHSQRIGIVDQPIRFTHGQFNLLTADPEANAANPKPGTVVDAVVVRPNATEFFLTSQQPSVGASSFALYTIIADDLGMSKNELEEMTYTLCFARQIVTHSSALPTPLHVAGLYTDRGRRLFSERKTQVLDEEDFNPNVILSYSGTPLEDGQILA